MSTKEYEDELDSLLSTSLSASKTPLQGGSAMISELTSFSHQSTDRNLQAAFKEEDSQDDNRNFNVGELITNISNKIVEEDNRQYPIKVVRELCDGNMATMCGQKRAGGKNTFCTDLNCSIDHRNDNADPISVKLNTILIMRSKNVAFISPTCDELKVTNAVLSEWQSQAATLAEWADRFLLVEMAEDMTSTREDLDNLKEFSNKAAAHKTPFKAPRIRSTLKSFTPHDRDVFLKTTKTLKDGGFGMSSLEYFSRVDKYLIHLEEIINDIITNMNSTNQEVFTTLRMLEMEKNRVKMELGNRKEISLNNQFDAASVWESVALISDALDVPPSSTPGKPSLSFPDVNFRTFETFTRRMLQDHQKLLKGSVSQSDFTQETEALRKENIMLRGEMRDMRTMIEKFEKMTANYDRALQNLNGRLNVLEEGGISGLGFNPDVLNDQIDDKFNELKKELDSLKPGNNTRQVKFQELSIGGLSDMLKWLDTNVPSMNYALIADVHTILEHVHHQINPSKSTLDFLQAIFKLEIPTPNHAVTIQSFNSSLPKFFCKSKDHKVVRGTESLFDNIKSYADWDLPNYGFRERLTEEIANAEIAIENAIREDPKVSDVGRSVLRNALSASVQGLDMIIRYIDQTYRELIRSKYTVEKAWHLVTMLIVRIFSDLFEPRVGKLNIMETKKPEQVATVVFHSSLQSIEAMRVYKEYGIAKHPNIASEYVKFIAHNTPYQLVETLEKKVSKVDEKVVEHVSKMQGHLKQLNSATQKVDKHDSKLTNLKARVSKLEKK